MSKEFGKAALGGCPQTRVLPTEDGQTFAQSFLAPVKVHAKAKGRERRLADILKYVWAPRQTEVSNLVTRMRVLSAGDCGQSTVEYAVIVAGLLSVFVALGALWQVLDGGALVEHALMSASHHMQVVAPGAVADVFLY